MKEVIKMYVMNMTSVQTLIETLLNNGYTIIGIKKVKVIKDAMFMTEYEIRFERSIEND